jgi:hypothetical protein
MDDATLEVALRDLSTAVAYPPSVAGGSDIATRVRQRIVAAPSTRRGGLLAWLRGRPIRQSLLVAVAVLLAIAAVAGAVGLGVPGIRIIFGGPTPPPATASPVPVPSSPLGISMGLGSAVPIEDAARIAGLDLVLPPDPAIGPPDASYILANRAALVWSARPGLPADPDTGVGLLISEFRGSVDEGYYTKSLADNATITPVTVAGNPGYWISGPAHFFYYVDPSGRSVDDSHRIVGDTLIWSDGDVTYRLESRLGRDEAIRFAESLR